MHHRRISIDHNVRMGFPAIFEAIDVTLGLEVLQLTIEEG